jgi:hypothetical protein
MRHERAVLTAWPPARAGRHAHASACFQELSALPPKGDQRSRLSVMVCHGRCSRRQLLANAAIAASRVTPCVGPRTVRLSLGRLMILTWMDRMRELVRRKCFMADSIPS